MQGTTTTNSSIKDDKNEMAESPKVLTFSDRRASFGDSPRMRKAKEPIDIVIATEKKNSTGNEKGEFDLVKSHLKKLK